MPTYEFACPSGHRFDRFYRKMSDAVSVLPCPECAAEATRQLSGGAGLIFKGSGFYITDYGKDGKKSPSAGAKSEGTTEGKTEGKTGGGGKSDGAGSGGGSGDTAGKPASGGLPSSGGKTNE